MIERQKEFLKIEKTLLNIVDISFKLNERPAGVYNKRRLRKVATKLAVRLEAMSYVGLITKDGVKICISRFGTILNDVLLNYRDINIELIMTTMTGGKMNG